MASTKESVRQLFSGRADEWAGWYADANRPTLEADNLRARQRLAFEMIEAAVRPLSSVSRASRILPRYSLATI